MKRQSLSRLTTFSSPYRLPTLALAAVATLFAGQAAAQSTSGNIFGHGPAGAKVDARSSAGAHRAVTIKDNGRYEMHSLPTGTYTITLRKNDAVVDTRKNIGLMTGRGAEIDFACPNDKCAATSPETR